MTKLRITLILIPLLITLLGQKQIKYIKRIVARAAVQYTIKPKRK